MRMLMLAGALAAGVPMMAAAQVVPAPVLEGTRLDVTATGEVTRVPDVARISAGVVSQAPTAAAALAANGVAMNRVIAALKRAGVADRDIQTSAVNLSPNYRYGEDRAQTLVGYGANNQVTVRFRDVRRAGAILDALVAAGANQINGPSLEIERPEAAMDEARTRAVAIARARAELYARAAGLRVARILLISESGGYSGNPPPPPVMAMRSMGESAETSIRPGEQAVQVSVQVSFELR